MAASTCTKCGGMVFDIQQVEPYGSRFKMYFVQCRMCGGVVGVIEYHNTQI
jgi:hypothetical protein